jgi:hypothetical protein
MTFALAREIYVPLGGAPHRIRHGRGSSGAVPVLTSAEARVAMPVEVGGRWGGETALRLQFAGRIRVLTGANERPDSPAGSRFVGEAAE